MVMSSDFSNIMFGITHKLLVVSYFSKLNFCENFQWLYISYSIYNLTTYYTVEIVWCFYFYKLLGACTIRIITRIPNVNLRNIQFLKNKHYKKDQFIIIKTKKFLYY